MSTLNPFKLDRAIRVDATIHGFFGECGPGGIGGQSGGWLFHFVPDASFDGSLAVVGRIGGQDAHDAGVPMVAIPYLAYYLNSAIPTAPMSWAQVEIASTSIFEVKASELSVGILFNVTSGFGWLYMRDFGGSV